MAIRTTRSLPYRQTRFHPAVALGPGVRCAGHCAADDEDAQADETEKRPNSFLSWLHEMPHSSLHRFGAFNPSIHQVVRINSIIVPAPIFIVIIVIKALLLGNWPMTNNFGLKISDNIINIRSLQHDRGG